MSLENIPPNSWNALLLAVAATIAEIDEVEDEYVTTEKVLRRIEWYLDDPYTNIPSMLFDDEVALQPLLRRLRDDVREFQARFSQSPPDLPQA